MATKIPIQGIIKINNREIKNTYWSILQDMKRVEKQLKGLTRGTKEYEEKSAELKEISKHFQEANNEIREQKGYLNKNTKATDDFKGSFLELKNAFSLLRQGDFQGFSQVVVGGFSSMKGAARSFFVTLMSNPITALIAVIGGLVLAIGAAAKMFFDYNKQIAPNILLTERLTKTTGDLADEIRNRATAMQEVFGVDFQENIKTADALVKTFGITYKEAFGLIEEGLIRGADKNGEFFESIEEFDVFFKKAGYSAQEFINILNTGADLNIYKDKLPDAIKEAVISLEEQTPATRKALENAFGKSFSDSLLRRVNTGTITVKDALQEIAEEAGKSQLSQQQLATLTADVFRSAGEDAGGASKIFQALRKSVDENKRPLTEMEQKLKEVAKSTTELQEAKDRFYKSNSLQIFMKNFEIIWNKIKTYYFKVMSFIKDNFLQSFRDVNRVLKEFGFSFKGVFSRVRVFFKGFLKIFLFNIQNVAKVITNLSDRIIAFKRSFIKEFSNIYGFLKEMAPEIGQLILDFFTPGKKVDTSRITEIYKKFANNIGDSFTKELNKIKTQRMLSDVLSETDEKVRNINYIEESVIITDDEENEPEKVGGNNSDKIDTGLKEAAELNKKWGDDLIAAQKEISDTEIELLEEGLQKKSAIINKEREEKLAKIKQEKADIIKAREDILIKLNELEELKANTKDSAKKAEIEKSISEYEGTLMKMENLLVTHKQREENINEIYDNKIRTAESENLTQRITERKSAFEQMQKEDLIRKNLEIEQMQISENEKEKLRKDFYATQVNEQKMFAEDLIHELNNLLQDGDFEGMNLQEMILTQEGKQLIEQNLSELGLSLDEIATIMAKIKNGGGGEDDFEGVGIISGGDVLGMSPDKWDQLFENLDKWQGKVEMVVAVTQAMQNAWATFHDMQMKKEQEALKRFEANIERKKEALKKQLDNGYINQQQYDAKIKQLEEQVAKRRAEMEYKQAKYEKQNAIINSIINTAVGISASLAKGGPVGIALAAIVGVMGAVQTALIASQPLPPKQGYAKGGHTFGLGYKDESGHEVAGVVHKDEYVIPKWLKQDPVVANVVDWLEAKRIGRDSQFAEGGSTDTVGVPLADYKEDSLKQNEYNQLIYGALIRVSEVLEKVEGDGVRAYVVGDEKEGKSMKKAIDSYNRLRNKNKH